MKERGRHNKLCLSPKLWCNTIKMRIWSKKIHQKHCPEFYAKRSEILRSLREDRDPKPEAQKIYGDDILMQEQAGQLGVIDGVDYGAGNISHKQDEVKVDDDSDDAEMVDQNHSVIDSDDDSEDEHTKSARLKREKNERSKAMEETKEDSYVYLIFRSQYVCSFTHIPVNIQR